MQPEPLTAAQRRLDEYMSRVGDIQQRAEQAQTQIKQMRAHASSPDGTVSVTLAPGGRLEKLILTPQALGHGHQRLATLITETIRAGHAAAARQLRDTMEPLVGGTPAMEFLSEQMGAAELDDPADSLATRSDQPPPGTHSAPPHATQPPRSAPPTAQPPRSTPPPTAQPPRSTPPPTAQPPHPAPPPAARPPHSAPPPRPPRRPEPPDDDDGWPFDSIMR